MISYTVAPVNNGFIFCTKSVRLLIAFMLSGYASTFALCEDPLTGFVATRLILDWLVVVSIKFPLKSVVCRLNPVTYVYEGGARTP